MFPLRGLVPIERDGLLGASKNIGVSSVVQSALRLHGQMMLCGQASATVAWEALRVGIQPRAVAKDPKRVMIVQRALVNSGVLIWPFHDLDPAADYFEAVNLLAVHGILLPDADSVRFQPDRIATPEEIAGVLSRAKLPALPGGNPAQTLTRAQLAKAVWTAISR
jgi:hypothetical protein